MTLRINVQTILESGSVKIYAWRLLGYFISTLKCSDVVLLMTNVVILGVVRHVVFEVGFFVGYIEKYKSTLIWRYFRLLGVEEVFSFVRWLVGFFAEIINLFLC